MNPSFTRLNSGPIVPNGNIFPVSDLFFRESQQDNTYLPEDTVGTWLFEIQSIQNQIHLHTSNPWCTAPLQTFHQLCIPFRAPWNRESGSVELDKGLSLFLKRRY